MESKTTTDHAEIREWVEERGGFPACVKGTGHGKDAGLLRIDFPDYTGEDTLERIGWDRFFETFDANDLAFLYQEKIHGETSRFCKLVSRETVERSRH